MPAVAVPAAFTLLFYLLAGLAVWQRSGRWRLLHWSGLPVVWITVCGVAGALETFASLPPGVTLAALLIACTVLACRRRATPALPESSWNRISLAGLVLASLLSIPVAWRAVELEPWASWDSMFTWVLRARFFHRGGEMWANTFSNDLALLHPDYPPLLGWALSGLWGVTGEEAPGAINWLVLPCWPAMALAALGGQRLLQGQTRLTVPIAVVLGIPLVWKLAASRTSDFVLTYAILSSVVWFECGRLASHRLALVASGFLAGWSALIKNEGLLWIAVCIAALTFAPLVSRRWNRSPCRFFLAGAALPVAIVIAFKMTLAPPSDLSDPTRVFEISEIIQPGTVVRPVSLALRADQLFEAVYHRLILQQSAALLWNWRDWGIALWLVPVLLVLRFRRSQHFSPLVIAVGLHLAGYYLVYLITPYHPYWHLSTSLSRILTHIAPAALWLLSAGGPGPDAEGAAESGHRRNALLASGYLILAGGLSLLSLTRGDWHLGEQPTLKPNELEAIEFPFPRTASYVSEELGNRDLYATQFAAVPTILLVDRREEVLLARFRSASALRHYCEQQGWVLQRQQGGVGWARSLGGRGLKQPVTVERMR